MQAALGGGPGLARQGGNCRDSWAGFAGAISRVGGSGGDGLGGGIFNDQGATATVTTSVIRANMAQGGLAGSGGSVGQGIGGGIFSAAAEKLSTSRNNLVRESGSRDRGIS